MSLPRCGGTTAARRNASPVGSSSLFASPPVPTTATSGARTPATPASKTSWSELDADGNGTLSAGEAGGVQSLSKVFVQADADANGELSQDEYKAWLAANGKGKAKAKSGG